MAIDYKLIGARIKKARKSQGKTQEKLAEDLQVTVGYISQIERGITKINLEMLSKLTAELDCDMAYLVSGIETNRSTYMSEEITSKMKKLDDDDRNMIIEIINVVLKYERK